LLWFIHQQPHVHVDLTEQQVLDSGKKARIGKMPMSRIGERKSVAKHKDL
jgi:hypothetical protein